ncbi:MAG: TonB-dependent receptor, partial [Bryobacteraceae bacterium]
SGALAPRPSPITPSEFVLDPSATTRLNSWFERYTTPYVQEWNFAIQKELPWQMVWETSYVGNAAVHLWGSYSPNQPVTNGPGAVVTRRPLAQYTVAPVMAYTPWNRSTYQGISSHLEKRFSKGLSFVASFTYGRALDLQNASLDACDGCEAGNGPQNSYNLAAQKGPSDNNVPLRFVLGGTWDLPFGPGRSLVKEGWVGHVVGLWQLSGIYQVQNGLPFTTILSFDNANAGNNSWPNRVCSGTLSSPTVSQWFDTSCFVAPAQYQFGNEGRNVLTGPGRNNLDFGLHRSFRLPFREGMALEFRAEAFNLFNHPQFSFPGSTIGTSTAGVIGSTAVPNREVQLALRLSF